MANAGPRRLPTTEALLTETAIHELHRRIRAVRIARRRLGRSVPAEREPRSLEELYRQLGTLRDRQVQVRAIERLERRKALTLSADLQREAARLRRRLARRLEDRSLRRYLAHLPPPTRSPDTPRSPKAIVAVRDRLASARRRAVRSGSAAGLHRFRKRLREMALLAGPGLGAGGTEAAAWEESSRRLLRRLGQAHDLAQLVDWLEGHDRGAARRRLLREVRRHERRSRRELIGRLEAAGVKAWCRPSD